MLYMHVVAILATTAKQIKHVVLVCKTRDIPPMSYPTSPWGRTTTAAKNNRDVSVPPRVAAAAAVDPDVSLLNPVLGNPLTHRSFRQAYLHKSVLPSLPPTWTCVNWASHSCELSHTRQNYLCEPLVRAMAGGREDRLVPVLVIVCYVIHTDSTVHCGQQLQQRGSRLCSVAAVVHYDHVRRSFGSNEL